MKLYLSLGLQDLGRGVSSSFTAGYRDLRRSGSVCWGKTGVSPVLELAIPAIFSLNKGPDVPDSKTKPECMSCCEWLKTQSPEETDEWHALSHTCIGQWEFSQCLYFIWFLLQKSILEDTSDENYVINGIHKQSPIHTWGYSDGRCSADGIASYVSDDGKTRV